MIGRAVTVWWLSVNNAGTSRQWTIALTIHRVSNLLRQRETFLRVQCSNTAYPRRVAVQSVEPM